MRNDEAAEIDPTQEHSCISITLADPNRPACILLFQHLWEELGQLYGNTGPCQFSPADVEGPGAAFVVSWLGPHPVGCGAILPLVPGVAEVKRMFVEPSARRRGIARQLLRELEAIARGLGYLVVRLETGVRQPEALRLYEAAGYQRVECYGRYAKDPLSICFEKQIGEHAA